MEDNEKMHPPLMLVPKIPVKSLVKLTVMKMNQLYWTLAKVKKIDMYFIKTLHQMNKDFGPASLIELALRQVTDVYWSVRKLKGCISNNTKAPWNNKTYPRQKPGESHHLNYIMHGSVIDKSQKRIAMLYKTLKKCYDMVDGMANATKPMMKHKMPVPIMILNQVITESLEEIPILYKKLKQMKGMIEAGQKTHPPVHDKKISVKSLIKLTAMKMNQLYWTMTKVKKIKNEIMSHPPNDKGMAVVHPSSLIKLALLQLTDVYWSLKKLNDFLPSTNFSTNSQLKVEVFDHSKPGKSKERGSVIDDSQKHIATLYTQLKKCYDMFDDMVSVTKPMMQYKWPVPKTVLKKMITESLEEAPILYRKLKQLGDILEENEKKKLTKKMLF